MNIDRFCYTSLGNWCRPIALGVAFGTADFLFSTACEKVGRLAGMTFEESEDEEDLILPSQRWDRRFLLDVVLYPILEELLFRGLLQPLCKSLIARCVPSLNEPSVLGLRGTALAASVAMGTTFGTIHYFNFKTNGWVPALTISIGGCGYGIARERYGLICTIVSHIMHNNCIGLLAKLYPSFLESEKEKAQRLQHSLKA